MINNVKSGQIYLFFLFTFVFFSCGRKESDHRPDVSHIPVDIQIKRFDLDLYRLKQHPLTYVNDTLHKAYGDFYEDYIQKMVGHPDFSTDEVLQSLYTHRAYDDLQKQVDSVYPSLSTVEKDLSSTFRYIKYYYPSIHIPHFISFVSGFAYQIPMGNEYIGIGLDMFLGKDSPFYNAIASSVPMYQSRRFAPAYIVPRITEVFAREELFPESDKDISLLSQMIYNGKILYFMDQVLPVSVNDTLKIGYTGAQMEWARYFEGNIWAHFLENELLYKSDLQKIQRYITDGPFTQGLGNNKNSAPRLGVWLGWQIVRKYMTDHPEVSLKELMANEDAQTILTKSAYKPKPKE